MHFYHTSEFIKAKLNLYRSLSGANVQFRFHKILGTQLIRLKYLCGNMHTCSLNTYYSKRQILIYAKQKSLKNFQFSPPEWLCW